MCKHRRFYKYARLRVDGQPMKNGQLVLRIDTVCLMCKADYQARYRARQKAKRDQARQQENNHAHAGEGSAAGRL